MDNMKPNLSLIGKSSKQFLLGCAIFFGATAFTYGADSIGYVPVANGVRIQVRKVETVSFDKQKRMAMKVILFIHDADDHGNLNSHIIGSETRVYNPETGQVTHVSVVGVAPYPIEANGAFVVVAPGAKNVSLKGDNNIVTLGGESVPPPAER